VPTCCHGTWAPLSSLCQQPVLLPLLLLALPYVYFGLTEEKGTSYLRLCVCTACRLPLLPVSQLLP
jgi:hypothetical protein